MIIGQYQKTFASITLGFFLTFQVLTVTSALLLPKPAEAGLIPGVPDFSIIIGDFYDIAKDAGLAALRTVAIKYATSFLQRFTEKLQNKYKIRNYLYYDQILSDYYLTNYIQDKISDPDLRQIYNLLNSGFVTGQNTGLNGAPNPNNALLPKLKVAISNYYLKHGGIDESILDNPPAGLSNLDYYSAAQVWSLNPPSFTQDNLQGQFGAFQSSATTAAQLEVLVGNGLKAGRVIGGTCKVSYVPPLQSGSWIEKLGFINIAHAQGTPTINGTNPLPDNSAGVAPAPHVDSVQLDGSTFKSPSSCQAVGGAWQPSALDNIRSFIDNPTTVVSGWLDAGLNKLLGYKFDPENYTAAVGSLIGDFLFNNLLSNKSAPVLNETPFPIITDDGSGIDISSKPIDIDGDGINDGYDSDGDGQLNSPGDICSFGGTNGGSGPPCQGSVNEGLSNGSTAGNGDNAHSTPDQTSAVILAKNSVIAAGVDPASSNCAAFQITKQAAINVGAGVLLTDFTTNADYCQGYSTDNIVFSNGDLIDVISSNLDPQWLPNGTVAGCNQPGKNCRYADPNLAP